MAWWGKLVGGAFGFLLGGPLGALLGAAVGHQFDTGMNRLRLEGFPQGGLHSGDQERVQAAFFTATFSIMGYVAKADGRVSPREIAVAEAVMSHMRLTQEQRKTAINLFNQGKEADFEPEPVLIQFRRECHRRTTLLQMFLEIQVQGALADGDIKSSERSILEHIAQSLGFDDQALDMLINMVSGANAQHQTGGRKGGSLEAAYKTLGLSSDAEETTIRKTYRRLMSQHHPDKLVAKGLPDEMVELANEKTHEIRTAYETIMEARGHRH